MFYVYQHRTLKNVTALTFTAFIFICRFFSRGSSIDISNYSKESPDKGVACFFSVEI